MKYEGSITDIKGIEVGHYSDHAAKTGCTAVLFRDGVVAGVDVRGAAPGTRETDLLRGFNLIDRIHAIMLSGGSAFGLAAATGAMEYLEKHGIGFNAGVAYVPIVPSAVIFDLAVGRSDIRPGYTEGYKACEDASAARVVTGAVGAGTGATVGKGCGIEYSMPGGVGSCCITLESGVKVAAIAVANAFGDIYDPSNGNIVAGAKKDGVFTPAVDAMMHIRPVFGNTTIGIVATDAQLTREEAAKLAGMAHDGLAMAIRPAHTTFDGDTFFGVATGEKGRQELLPILIAATEATIGAVLCAVGMV
jgi:L-aminopeptidase/D-esterase-like protein